MSIIYDNDVPHYSLDVTPEEIEREKEKLLQDKTTFENDNQSEDKEYLMAIANRIEKINKKVEQLDEKLIKLNR